VREGIDRFGAKGDELSRKQDGSDAEGREDSARIGPGKGQNMGEELVLTEVEGGVGTITLNRPPVNALSSGLLLAVESALLHWLEDTEVRCAVITGQGEKIFSAGADVKEIQKALGTHAARELVERGHSVFRHIETFPKPVIAALNGHALGGGLELAMACHMRLAREGSRVALPEINLGIMPGFGGTYRLTKICGMGRALQLVLTGEQVQVADMVGSGLIHRVFSRESFEQEVKEFAAGIAAKAPIALREAMKAVVAASKEDSEKACRGEVEAFCVLAATADAQEGVSALLDKREPTFRGR